MTDRKVIHFGTGGVDCCNRSTDRTASTVSGH